MRFLRPLFCPAGQRSAVARAFSLSDDRIFRHISNRSAYAVLEHPNSKYRRLPRLPGILQRLTAYDYVLEHSSLRWYALTRAKLDLMKRLGVSRPDLPQRTYQSRYDETPATPDTQSVLVAQALDESLVSVEAPSVAAPTGPAASLIPSSDPLPVSPATEALGADDLHVFEGFPQRGFSCCAGGSVVALVGVARSCRTAVGVLPGCAAGCAFGRRVAGFFGGVLGCFRLVFERVAAKCATGCAFGRSVAGFAGGVSSRLRLVVHRVRGLCFPLFRIRPGCLVCSKRTWVARCRSLMPRTVSSSAPAGASTARVGTVRIAVTPGSLSAFVPLVPRSADAGVSIPRQPRRRVLRRCSRGGAPARLFRIRPGCLVCSKRTWVVPRRSLMPCTVSSSAPVGASTARAGMVRIAVTPRSLTALVPPVPR